LALKNPVKSAPIASAAADPKKPKQQLKQTDFFVDIESSEIAMRFLITLRKEDNRI